MSFHDDAKPFFADCACAVICQSKTENDADQGRIEKRIFRAAGAVWLAERPPECKALRALAAITVSRIDKKIRRGEPRDKALHHFPQTRCKGHPCRRACVLADQEQTPLDHGRNLRGPSLSNLRRHVAVKSRHHPPRRLQPYQGQRNQRLSTQKTPLSLNHPKLSDQPLRSYQLRISP